VAFHCDNCGTGFAAVDERTVSEILKGKAEHKTVHTLCPPCYNALAWWTWVVEAWKKAGHLDEDLPN
jgi:hypothetical protein